MPLTWPGWLPQPLVNALLRSVTSYSEKKSQFLAQHSGYDYTFSVTEINQAPKVIWLKRQFNDVLTIDVLEDNWWSLMGSMFHKILEENAPSDCIVEDRQHVMLNIDGMKVLLTGEPDLYEPKTQLLTDYKFVSASALMYSQQGYIDQLRANAFLLESRGVKVSRIANAYCMRYIDRRLQRQDPENYPQTNVVMKEYPLLSHKETLGVLNNKISRILQYKDTKFKKLPDCTPEERWEHGSWGVHVKYKDKKRADEWMMSKAKGRFQEERDAIKFAEELGEATKIEYKKGEPTLCHYCNVVQFCQQRQAELKEVAAKHDERILRTRPK
jgi:hypothetical protein